MKIYGLIGYPVRHSLSPAMQNAAFKHLGIDAEYRLFQVTPDELEEFFFNFKKKLCGINITIPHKESSIKYMDELRGEAKEIGAINTVVLEDNRLIGYNTDGVGFLRSLKEGLDFRPASKKAIIFGAGGASRAVSFGLLREKIERIILVDIDGEKAISLASDLKKAGCNAIALEYDKRIIGNLVLDSELLVNATPCGMKEGDPELLPSKFLHERLSIFDLIYNPKETRLFKEAKKRNLKVVNGMGMLLYQGAEAFELWTGQKAPIEVMRKALPDALKKL